MTETRIVERKNSNVAVAVGTSDSNENGNIRTKQQQQHQKKRHKRHRHQTATPTANSQPTATQHSHHITHRTHNVGGIAYVDGGAANGGSDREPPHVGRRIKHIERSRYVCLIYTLFNTLATHTGRTKVAYSVRVFACASVYDFEVVLRLWMDVSVCLSACEVDMIGQCTLVSITFGFPNMPRTICPSFIGNKPTNKVSSSSR